MKSVIADMVISALCWTDLFYVTFAAVFSQFVVRKGNVSQFFEVHFAYLRDDI